MVNNICYDYLHAKNVGTIASITPIWLFPLHSDLGMSLAIEQTSLLLASEPEHVRVLKPRSLHQA